MKQVFIRSSYYYYCEKPICMRCTVTQLARESVGLCPLRCSYVREFELSHSNRVNRIIKITHAHNLHVKMLVFDPFTIRALKKRKLFTTKFSQRFEEITLASLQHLQLNYVSCNVKVDSLTIINFQENYQTAEIYFCSYHVAPLNKAVPIYCVN